MADHGFGALELGDKASTSNQGKTFFPRVACAVYDFSVDGGAQAQITPRDTVTIPAGSVVYGALIKTTTAVTSGGAATVSVDLVNAADLLAATGKASFTDDSVQAGKIAPDNAPILLTADAAVKITVGTADLTAGVIEIIVLYAEGVEGAS